MPHKPHCETRNRLSALLVDVSIRLSIAAAQMADLAALSDAAVLGQAKVEVERLRDQCENVKSELERHRAQHGC